MKTTIDAHSHMPQGKHPLDNIPTRVEDLVDFDMQTLLNGMDELGIATVVSLAQEMTRVRSQWIGSNELAADLQARFGGRFVGIAGFEPLTPKDQFNAQRFEEVRELVRVRRVSGLLITPPYGHFKLNDRRAYPFYQMAVEYDVPIYVHQGAMFGTPENTPQYGGSLSTLDEVVVDFPTLRLNIEHMAWPWTEELLAIMAHGPNVYTDVTMLSMRPHMLAWNLTMARDYGFMDRIFWGTDYVGTDTSVYLESVRSELEFFRNDLNPVLKKSGWPILTDDELDGVLCDNIRKFLDI